MVGGFGEEKFVHCPGTKHLGNRSFGRYRCRWDNIKINLSGIWQDGVNSNRLVHITDK
jgi:hypothetical protein